MLSTPLCHDDDDDDDDEDNDFDDQMIMTKSHMNNKLGEHLIHSHIHVNEQGFSRTRMQSAFSAF